jgi:Rps23 Pro-64 3,4-dihydroxylase Tpa1-like proline 4-hydroxylase
MNLSTDEPLAIQSIEFFSEPFEYFVSAEGFNRKISQKVLEWLETGAPWKLVKADFYEQYEFNFLDVYLPPQLAFLQEQSFFDNLRAIVEQAFQTPLSRKIDATAHKLLPEQRIRIHNDFIPGRETHRLLIQLNRGWDNEQGGWLIFFNSSDPADIHKIFLPLHNTVISFAISPNSNHAVSGIRRGERFTLVYSFYGDE